MAFEFSGSRTVLLLFPNTFEYFFIASEVVRLRWDTRRLSAKAVYGLAAAIWIGVKLLQEYWIHIAQLDFTDAPANRAFAAVTQVTVACGFIVVVNAWLSELLRRRGHAVNRCFGR